VAKLQFLLKYDKNALNKDQCTFMIKFRLVIFGMRNVSDKSFRESRNIHFMYSILSVNHAVCEIKWKYIVE